MSSLTAYDTPVQADDRSVSAPAETRREAACTGGGRPAVPEVAAVPRRRTFTSAYKLRILKEIEQNPGMTGVVLRREGLYSSSLTSWRRWKETMNTSRRPVTANKQMHNELARLKRENARLKMKLDRAEGLIELQKKTSELLRMMSRQASNDE